MYIYIYIIYLFLSLLFNFQNIELLFIFSGKRSREFRCALRTERCRLHTSFACTLNYAYIYIYIYLIYIIYLFLSVLFYIFKDRIVDYFFPENDLASSAVRCAPSAVVCIHR